MAELKGTAKQGSIKLEDRRLVTVPALREEDEVIAVCCADIHLSATAPVCRATEPDWLAAQMPDRAAHVMSLLQAASGGKDYDNRFGRRQRGRGPYAKMIADRFSTACRRYGLRTGRQQRALDCTLFRPPGQQQMALGFD